MQNKNSESFLAFFKKHNDNLRCIEHNFGLQIDYFVNGQLKSILFHYIIGNECIDLSKLSFNWIVWEDIWVKKPSIVKASILAQLGDIKTIHGRKTNVRLVDKDQANLFLSNNHLGDPRVGKIRYGLFFEERLVGLMCFSAGRNWKQKEGKSYEIIRFCNHKSYRVHGGFSKLLKQFISDKNPVQLMTYADATWYQSSMYEQCGFIKHKEHKYLDVWITTETFERSLLKNQTNTPSMHITNFKSYKFTWEN